jgi:hypothetical protein
MKVLFARIGWMQYYAAPQPSDPRPLGGGSYNEQHRGSEMFNFKRLETRGTGEILYGFVAAPNSGGGRLNLRRIDPASNGDSLAGVLVVFVASQKIVGWYRNATVLRELGNDSSGQRLKSEGGRTWPARYNLKAVAGEAVLLPLKSRTHPIPRGKSGLGQANVRYAYSASLKPDLPDWMQNAIEYVNDYEGENLLTNPIADIGIKVDEDLEKSAGYQSDPAIRKAVEDHAMMIVEQEYRRNYSVRNTSKGNPYDLLCEKDGEGVYVEVKGTQTTGGMVSLTYNEVRLAGDARRTVDLCVVHSIKVSSGNQPKTSGGVLVVYPDWNPDEHELKPVHYVCKLKPQASDASR